jgi:hypothetical protein
MRAIFGHLTTNVTDTACRVTELGVSTSGKLKEGEIISQQLEII